MEVHRDPEQETSLPQSEKPHCEGYSVGNTHELLLDGRFIMDLLSFTTCPSFCQCLMVNRAFCKGVRSYLSTLVVDPEENQGWIGTNCPVGIYVCD